VHDDAGVRVVVLAGAMSSIDMQDMWERVEVRR